MNDRELLELAAKAAGVELVGPVEKFIVQFDERHKGGFIVRNDRGGDSSWNPLTDDGDALRLAVALRMDLRIQTLPHAIYIQAGNGCAASALEMLEHKNAETVDAYAATRRAIVRAAAEIGAQYE